MKKFLVLLLVGVMLLSLACCTETPSDPTSDVPSDTSTDSSQNTSSNEVEADPVPNLVIANDQLQERVVIYDLDQYQPGDTLDDLEYWSKKTTHAAGVKYRTNTVFGDVIIVAGTRSQIIKYPSGDEVWGTGNSGDNPHSIEILPSGNIVIASSTGGTVRLFRTAALLEGGKSKANTYKDYKLKGAHGVLWDPEYGVLWAVGDDQLVAYSISGSGADEELVPMSDMGCRVSGGHDLSADYTDTRYLYLTGSDVYRFDKETDTLTTTFPQSSKLQGKSVKGFSNNPNGNFFKVIATGGKGTSWEKFWKESWLTDTILYYERRVNHGTPFLKEIKLTSKKSAFYKTRAFYGEYQ